MDFLPAVPARLSIFMLSHATRNSLCDEVNIAQAKSFAALQDPYRQASPFLHI
jgi:hypothetical protein